MGAMEDRLEMNGARKQPTIMVVDDIPDNLTVLEKMLREQGYRVVAFPRGDLALKAAARKPPDLILLDIMMPGMDGFAVCERLKADATLKEIPVLFISGLSETRDKLKAFFAGGVDYVTKPFQPEEVRVRVETHLQLRDLRVQLEKHNRRLEDLVAEKVIEISESQMATIYALAKLAERRDDETGRHIDRTRTYCKVLACNLRKSPGLAAIIDETYVDTLQKAAPLHDIGKVGIVDNILLKPGRLSPEEFEIIKTHTTIGADTLGAVRRQYPQNAFISMGIAIARSHHEKWDGSGYPDGLSGGDIPLCARIMALADVYDALRSKRPYKDAFSHEKACRIITEEAGRHFDPVIVDAFTAVAAEFAEIRERLDDGAS